MNNNRLGRDFTAQLMPRLQELRTAVAGPAPRDTLPMELVEELQTAIEELRVIEEELRSQQGQLEDAWLAAESASDWNRALFDGAADAMLVTDAEGVVRDANEAAGTLLNLAAKSMRGKPLAVFVPTEERTEFRTRLCGLVQRAAPRALRRVPAAAAGGAGGGGGVGGPLRAAGRPGRDCTGRCAT